METMKELLDRLKRELGDDWPEKLAQEMTTEDRERLWEALDRNRGTSSPNQTA